MRIRIEAEGDRGHFRMLLQALGALIVDGLMDRLPLSVTLDGDLVDDVIVKIGRKPEPES